MNAALKRVLIAAVLVAVCAFIVVATKRYGVWVIIGTAIVLFILGLLRKENPSGKGGEVQDDADRQPGNGKKS